MKLPTCSESNIKLYASDTPLNAGVKYFQQMNYSMLINRCVIFFINLFILLFSSCSKNEDARNDMIRELSFKVDISDEFINDMLLQYADSNKLNPKICVLSLNIKNDSHRLILYISHSNTHFQNYTRFPSHYTFVGEYLVLLYSDLDAFIKNDFIEDELIKVAEVEKMDLIKGNIPDDTPILKIVKCEDHVRISYEVNDLQLPCFLKLGVRGNQIVIEEEEWFKDLKMSGIK